MHQSFISLFYPPPPFFTAFLALHWFPLLLLVSKMSPPSRTTSASQQPSGCIMKKKWSCQGCCWEPPTHCTHHHCPFLSHTFPAQATAAPPHFGDVSFSKHWDSYRLTSGEWKHWFCVDLAPAAHLWEPESGSVSIHWAKENLFWYCNCKNWHVNMNDRTCLQLLICASR